jgi:multidrug resistance efflux pump
MKKFRSVTNRIAGYLLFIPVAIIIALLATGCGGGKAEKEIDGPSIEYGESSESSSILAFGSVVATNINEIHLPWTGRIVEIPVWVGKSVVLGDLLAVFDENDRVLALEVSRLNAASALSRLEEASSQLGSLEVTVTEAAGRLERTRRLVDGGSVSAQDLSSLQAEYDTLVHDRDASRWVLAARRGEAEGAAAEEQRVLERSSEAYLDGNRIICPFNEAIVAEIVLRSGAEAESGSLLMVLHDNESLLVEADLPEEFIRDVEIGNQATIIPVADPDRSYTGTVIEIAGLASLVNGENVVKIRIRLDERDGFLREGFNVDAEI